MAELPAPAAEAGPPGGGTLWVGEWELDPGANELRRGGEVQHLEPKAIAVLAHLARHPGMVVGREELLAAVWPGVVVGDDALTQAIIKLRKALGDEARRPSHIETISKRGYRLIAPVRAPAAEAPAAPARRSFGRGAWSGLVAVLALAALAVFFAADLGRRAEAPPRSAEAALPVVAVLPLANLSGDPRRDYYSDGLTEDIITALGRYSGLRVIARASVEQFRQRPAAAEAVREALGARYVVDGSVREAADGLRISVALADAQSGQVLWAERYEGRDVFEIQERIVRTIVGALAVKVSRQEHERIRAKPPRDLEAYDLVLRARALVVKTERPANAEARRLLARAQEMAPDYAMSYVVLAEAEYRRAMEGWVEDPGENLARAEAAARHALTLDDPGANARAHGQLGLVHVVRREYERALAEADQALAGNPSDAFALDARGDILLWLGRLEEAIASLQAALSLDPAGRSGGSGFDLALAYYSLGRDSEALATVDATLARYPHISFLHALRAATLAQLGRLDEARKAADELRRLSPFFPARQFGDKFVDPAHMARLQEGLGKAGL